MGGDEPALDAAEVGDEELAAGRRARQCPRDVANAMLADPDFQRWRRARQAALEAGEEIAALEREGKITLSAGEIARREAADLELDKAAGAGLQTLSACDAGRRCQPTPAQRSVGAAADGDC